MRKLSILSQIVIIFVTILLFSCSIFSFAASTITKIGAKEEVYSRLISYSSMLARYKPEDNRPITDGDMTVEFLVINNNKEVLKTTGFSTLINHNDMSIIIETFNEQRQIICKDVFKNHNEEAVYFVVDSTSFGEYIIMVTDSTYILARTKLISSRLLVLFTIISSVSILIIGLWGKSVVSRIKKLQGHIDLMPKNQYEKTYEDSGFDEISELAKSIESMRKEIYSSESAKKEMLQNISHDFKTPIAVIKSYAEAQIDGMTDEESSKIIITNADILKHKVNMLLEYNSLEYLSKNKEFEDVNMKEVITDVVQGYKFQTDLQIELELDEDVYFKGYKDNYYTVVDNIIDNAKRYAKSTIKIILKKDRLRIYNDGEHISEEFVETVFKPYEKGSNGQFGLGLSIVQKTLDFFDMQIKIVNEEVGVSFIITTRK